MFGTFSHPEDGQTGGYGCKSVGAAVKDVMEKSLCITMKHRKCSQVSLIALCVCVCAFVCSSQRLLFIDKVSRAILKLLYNNILVITQ